MSPEQIDFRAEGDDAWYSATVELDGDVLRLKYCDFSEKHDQILKAGDFKSLSEIELFEDRFRPASVQAQDSECSKVLEGDVVCASSTFENDDLRFYDALVDGVSVSLFLSVSPKRFFKLSSFVFFTTIFSGERLLDWVGIRIS